MCWQVLSGLAHGLAVAFEPMNLFYCLVGCLLGTMIGVLPGLGPLNAMAMLLPISYYLPPEAALIMLAGIYYGAQFGGSTTSILVNMPGEMASDRHLSRRPPDGAPGPGRPGARDRGARFGVRRHRRHVLHRALRSAACPGRAAVRAGRICVADAAWTDRGGRACPRLGSRRRWACSASAFCWAQSALTSSRAPIRMTLGIPQLADGIGIVPVAMGLFGVGEIIANLEKKEKQVTCAKAASSHLWPSRDDFRRCWPVVLRATGLGSILGLLAGRRRDVVVLRGLRAREEALGRPVAVRQGCGRRRCCAGGRQQCGRADLVHPAVDAWASRPTRSSR